MMSNPKLVMALGAALTLSLAACDTQTDCCRDDPVAVEAGGSVVEVLGGDASFSSLVDALESSGLADRLDAMDEVTIFAPTDAAFSKLVAAPQADALEDTLTYHIVDGAMDAESLILGIEDAGKAGYTITTLNGATLTATREDGGIILTDGAGNQALIEATDVEASNGLVHVIDTVLTPQ